MEIRISPKDVCDFCSSEKWERVYPCQDFDIAGLPATSVGSWCACDACAELIDAEKWDELAERSINSFPYQVSQAERPVLVAFIKETHKQFRDRRPAQWKH